MSARHVARREPAGRPGWFGRHRLVTTALAGALVLIIVVVAASILVTRGGRRSLAGRAVNDGSTRASLELRPASGGASTDSSYHPAGVPAAHAEYQSPTDPTAVLTALTAGLGPTGASVAVLNVTTGATFTFGASGGMVLGSAAKLDTLETLLLQHEDAKTLLSANEVSLATAMIEQSDNNAADALWASIGSDPAVRTANVRLGIPGLVVGLNGLWGLGTTTATDQVTLLRNLVRTDGPLDAASQAFALSLMTHVTAGQRWGVGSVADAGTTFANKNGWLANDADNDRWLVNSDGIVTVHGQQLLMSVLTQHNSSMASGVTLVEKIAAAVAS
jgi:hypothetical protein